MKYGNPNIYVSSRTSSCKTTTRKPDKDMPSPSKEEQNSPEFNAIWNIIKTWDINVPEFYSGYTEGNGSHVKLLLDALKPVLRNNKIDEILK